MAIWSCDINVVILSTLHVFPGMSIVLIPCYSAHMDSSEFPMRINKYLAQQGHSTRRGADTLIEKGVVFINGKKAVLGDKILETDKVEVRLKEKQPAYIYFAYNKPVGVVTHSPQNGEKDVLQASGLKGVFPIGRLDKDSHGLIILTNDGRITDPLLNPDSDHEKEYEVQTKQPLRSNFKVRMEEGVQIDDYTTKPCIVHIVNENTFRVTLTEGKKHQIRRMVVALHNEVHDLKRIRIMNITLGKLATGNVRKIEGTELKTFLSSLGR
jgi:23S rRNA pseudouridine2604 synthase